MTIINIKASQLNNTILDINIDNLYTVNLYRNLISTMNNIKNNKSQFYLTSNINYYKGDMCRLSISKILNEGCSLRFFMGHYGKIIFDTEINSVNYDKFTEFLNDICNGTNTELRIGTQSIIFNFIEI